MAIRIWSGKTDFASKILFYPSNFSPSGEIKNCWLILFPWTKSCLPNLFLDKNLLGNNGARQKHKWFQFRHFMQNCKLIKINFYWWLLIILLIFVLVRYYAIIVEIMVGGMFPKEPFFACTTMTWYTQVTSHYIYWPYHLTENVSESLAINLDWFSVLLSLPCFWIGEVEGNAVTDNFVHTSVLNLFDWTEMIRTLPWYECSCICKGKPSTITWSCLLLTMSVPSVLWVHSIT